MSLEIYKAIAAGLIFFISIATVIYPLKKQGTLTLGEPAGLGEALASGIFLGAAFFHMLPDALRMYAQAAGAMTYPIPEAVCVLGFLLMLFLERLALVPATVPADKSIPYVLTLILIIHAIVEGAALGIGGTFSEAFIIFIAILAHKGSESFALCMTLLRQRLPFRSILFIVIFFALMTPVGIGLGTAINFYSFAKDGELIGALFNAFAAGTFLYISTLHHIHFHRHANEARGLVEYGCLVLGVVLMGTVAIYT